jgi:hypothetical protein
MNNNFQINALNPVTDEIRVAKIAKCLNQNKMDYRHILDISSSALLVLLLYDESKLDREKYNKCIDLADKAGLMLQQQCSTDKQRFLAITYLLKSMVSIMFNKGVFN